MPKIICDSFCLDQAEVEQLWQQVSQKFNIEDHKVSVKCASSSEIKQLNKKYRDKDKATNVLTFNYEKDHDIVLCLDVVEEEARENERDLKEYTVYLLVHSFLHAAGMDHDSDQAAEKMEAVEQEIILSSGVL